MKIRLVPRGAKAGLGWVVCYFFHTLLCLLSFHLEIGAFVLRVDCRCLLWAQFAASFFLREHCFCFVLSTKKSCAPRCCGCMRQRKGSPYTWALCGSATKWDAYIRTRKPVGTKPSSCSTSDSAPTGSNDIATERAMAPLLSRQRRGTHGSPCCVGGSSSPGSKHELAGMAILF